MPSVSYSHSQTKFCPIKNKESLGNKKLDQKLKLVFKMHKA